MRVGEPFRFELTHLGRGGTLACRCEAGEIGLAIELVDQGNFAVWLLGARLTKPDGTVRRLRTDERKLVLERVRAWLDANGRERWYIES
jgi:hypothetical protein